MRKILYLLSGVFVAITGVAAAAPAHATLAYTYTIDCLDSSTSQTRLIEPGSTVTLVVNNCQVANQFGQGTHSWTPGSPMQLTAGTWAATETFTAVIGAQGTGEQVVFNHLADGTGTQAYIYLLASPLVPNPEGELLGAESITIAPNAGTMNIATQGLTGSDGNACAMQDGAHSYGTTTINITQSGTYTFRVTAVMQGTSDPVIGIYSAFDATQPATNLIACNDDAGRNGYLESDPQTYINNLFSEIIVALEPGTYILMGTTFNPNDPNTGWTFTTDQSTTVEMWGPPLPPVVVPASLAVTGSTISGVLPWAAFIIVLGAGSIVLMKNSRRTEPRRH